MALVCQDVAINMYVCMYVCMYVRSEVRSLPPASDSGIYDPDRLVHQATRTVNKASTKSQVIVTEGSSVLALFYFRSRQILHFFSETVTNVCSA